jgi:amidase
MNDPYNALVMPIEQLPEGSGTLEGLRFVAKDLFDVAGLATSAGNPQFAERWGIPSQDAWAVAALKKAGARLIGKSYTHELAYGMTGINPHYGTPHNPKVAGGIPGGSSSGSGVAVASGMVPLALGSDTGGSVRIPASLCGTYAYRPTHGAISAQGVVALAPSYDTVGLLAANPEVMEQAARVLLHDALPMVPFERAVIMSDALELSAPEAQLAVQRTAEKLERLGVKVEENRLRLLQEARETQRVLQGAQAWGYHQKWVEEVGPTLGADVRKLLEMASRFSPSEIGQAISNQVLLRAEMGSWLEPGTLVLMPSTPSSAPQIGGLQDADTALEFRWRTLSLTCYASVLGAPAVAVPTEQTGEAPIGVQLIGAWGADMGLLRLARRLEGCA